MKCDLSEYEPPGTIPVSKLPISKPSLQTGSCVIECLISLGRINRSTEVGRK